MSRRQPPRLATWLLTRSISGPKNEALIGDLIERYHGGRSALWYDRQVLRAIAANAVGEAMAHKVFALRAVVVGWLALDLVLRADWAALYAVWPAPVDLCPGTGCIQAPPHVFQMTQLLSFALAGWVVGRLHRPRAMSMVMMVALLWVAVVLVVVMPQEIRTMALQSALPLGWRISHIMNELFGGVLVVPATFMLGGLLSTFHKRPDVPLTIT